MADFFEPPYIGTPNPDEMFGTPEGEVFMGFEGADDIFGEGGGDKIYGGGDGDWIEGGAGNDRIWGEDGNDQIRGDSGDDTIKGGRGNDHIDAGTGDDEVRGEQGRDDIDGGDGNDCLHGNSGRDTLFGGTGDDTMFGEGSKDTLDGGTGDDAMSGGAQDDVMTGGLGNDLMKGDAGNDVVAGGDGDDTLLGGDGADTVTGDAGDDRLDGGNGGDVVDGGDGSDLIAGGGGDDTLIGGAGNGGNVPGLATFRIDTFDTEQIVDGNGLVSGSNPTSPLATTDIPGVPFRELYTEVLSGQLQNSVNEINEGDSSSGRFSSEDDSSANFAITWQTDLDGNVTPGEAADAFAVVPEDADLTQCELFNLNVRNNVPSSEVGVATWTPLEYIFTDADGDVAAARFELIGNFINLTDLPFALSEFVVDQGDVANGGAADPGTVLIPNVLRQGVNDVNANLDFDRIVRIDLYAPIADTDFNSDERPDLATAQDFSIDNIGIRCEVAVEGCAPDTFLFRQDEVQGTTDTDVIVDWDECDVIGLCGQIDPFFTVEKVEIGIFDNFANTTRDVRVGLSNGQFITILDAGDSGDWEADDVDPENNAVNADNFVRLSPEECAIDGDVVCA
jgi:Ca2+-binding RTX toxin-like protein